MLLFRRLTGCLLALALGMHPPAGSAQSATQPASQTQSSTTSSTATPTDVSGRVLNLRSHQPIARALVQLGSRRVLTDHDGVFRFPAVTAASGSFTVTKPGFFPESDTGSSRTYAFPSTSAIDLGLAPEAILSGTVVNPSGEGIPEVSVMARSSTYDETGHHWRSAGQTRTQSDGSFRLSLPQGVYVLQVRAAGRPIPGVQMVQPLSVPASPSLQEALHLASGDQLHLDLHPDLRRVYQVALTSESGSERGFPMLTARGANGITIPLGAMPSRENPGEFTVALPNGTYTLMSTTQNEEGRQQADTRVTVAGHDVSGVVLRFAPSPRLSVVIELDTSSTSDNATSGTTSTVPATPPTPQQLNLTFLTITGPGDLTDQAYRPETRRDAAPAFALPTGTYRLHAQSTGQWFVTAASCAGSDLLQQNLVVSPGMGGAEVRVRVSNQTASLQGTVTLGGAPSSAWVYLVATTPSATPVQILRAGSGGTFSRSNLAPGSYRAVALEHRIPADFQNAETINRFLGRVQSFSVTVGEQHTLTLDVVPNGDLTQ